VRAPGVHGAAVPRLGRTRACTGPVCAFEVLPPSPPIQPPMAVRVAVERVVAPCCAVASALLPACLCMPVGRPPSIIGVALPLRYFAGRRRPARMMLMILLTAVPGSGLCCFFLRALLVRHIIALPALKQGVGMHWAWAWAAWSLPSVLVSGARLVVGVVFGEVAPLPASARFLLPCAPCSLACWHVYT